MKNESMPAFPLQFGNDGVPILFNDPRNSEDMLKKLQPAFGLTKLEYFAGLALQGLMANPEVMSRLRFNEFEVSDLLSERAISQARNLISELEKHQ